MIHRIFAIVLVAALFFAESLLRSSNDQADGDASAIAKPDAVPDSFAVATDVAGAGPQWSADIAWWSHAVAEDRLCALIQ